MDYSKENSVILENGHVVSMYEDELKAYTKRLKEKREQAESSNPDKNEKENKERLPYPKVN